MHQVHFLAYVHSATTFQYYTFLTLNSPATSAGEREKIECFPTIPAGRPYCPGRVDLILELHGPEIFSTCFSALVSRSFIRPLSRTLGGKVLSGGTLSSPSLAKISEKKERKDLF